MPAIAGTSPVQDVSFGQGMKISLDNYYEILKANIGGLASDEYLQLKMIADPVELSVKNVQDKGYRWFSYYNLLKRSDMSIVPTAVSGQVMSAIASLADVYGEFLLRLRGFVVQKNLSPQEQQELADLDTLLESLRRESRKLAIMDRTDWKDFAEAMGYDVGDQTAYFQWSGQYGHLREIQDILGKIRDANFKKKSVLDRQYPDQSDRKIVEAEFDYENPAMRLRYPVMADYEYPEGDRFNSTYLALLPIGSTALFEDRRVLTWQQTLEAMKTTTAGAFTAKFDKNTQESKAIVTDWKGSASASYGFISVRANASEHREISDDFKKGTTIELSAEAAFRANINLLPWFKPGLFESHHVKDNPYDFEDFFGSQGRLLYYPTALVLVRGFKAKFTSNQKWVYDYKRHFSASGGGGFGAFGISFGGSASYSEDVKEHKVDQSNTEISFGDDKDTVRFIGYAVKKNTVFEKAIKGRVEEIDFESRDTEKLRTAPTKKR